MAGKVASYRKVAPGKTAGRVYGTTAISVCESDEVIHDSVLSSALMDLGVALAKIGEIQAAVAEIADTAFGEGATAAEKGSAAPCPTGRVYEVRNRVEAVNARLEELAAEVSRLNHL